jgi:hypothetical protein
LSISVGILELFFGQLIHKIPFFFKVGLAEENALESAASEIAKM